MSPTSPYHVHKEETAKHLSRIPEQDDTEGRWVESGWMLCPGGYYIFA